MPIFKTPKGLLYFAHVPRAGGSSVENHLRAQFGAPAFLDRGFNDRDDRWTATSPQHVTAEVLAQLFPEGFFDHVFAVVRHPIDRLVSVYRYQKLKEQRIGSETSFDDWISGPALEPGYDNHALPQSAFVPKRARFFRLEEGLDKVARYAGRRLGAEGSGGIRHLNRSQGQIGPVTVSDRTLDLIREHYSEDFERFGYRVEDAVTRRGRPPESSPAFAIRVAAPSKESGKPWGEHAFAEGLASALERQGHQARIDYVDQWDRTEAGEIELVIRGHGYRKRVFVPGNGAPSLMWNIYPAWPDFAADELAAFDHVWCASQPACKSCDGILMPQAFDATRMFPCDEPVGTEIVLVANNYERGRMRRMAEWALQAELNIAIWGDGWTGTPAERFVRGVHLPNAELSGVYGNALAVLNDHANDMGASGFPSNRIFDALACAAPVVSDPVAWLPDDLARLVWQVASADELDRAIDAIRRGFQAGRATRLVAAEDMRKTHSFDARAREIIATAGSLSKTEMEDVA